MKQADDFFRYSRERHNVYLLRRNGEPAPWTDDPVLNRARFTNIFRELDRVTVWYRQNIREPLHGQRAVVPWTAIFRWFNRVETGQALLRHMEQMEVGGLGLFDAELAEAIIRDELPKGPYVTGAYMMHSPYGVNKLTGMLQYCQKFVDWYQEAGQYEFFDDKDNPRLTMQEAHSLLLPLDGFAGFTAYEVITDLRYAGAVRISDRMMWAHAGPGATRGGSRVLYGEPDRLSQGNREHQSQLRRLMMDLRLMSRDPRYWPQDDPDWPEWELREVEHTLCEWDKYERVRREQGRAKNSFNPLARQAVPLPDAHLGGL